MIDTLVLGGVVLAELLIFTYVTAYVCMYIIPWDDLAEKRRIRAEVALLIPQLRERAAEVAKRAAAPKSTVRATVYRQMADRMTGDVVKLTALCRRSITTVATEYKTWPREAMQIIGSVSGTLDAVDRIIVLRDEGLPKLLRFMADTACERIDSLESVRATLRDRVMAEEQDGIIMTYESQRLSMLSNALSAHRLLAKDDPDAAMRHVPKWLETLQAIAESIELRASVARRVVEVAVELPVLVKRVRTLAEAVRPDVGASKGAALHQSAGARFVLAQAAESGIARAEEELRRAQAGVALAGRDIGAKGESARRLMAAFRSAELGMALLGGFEKDLMTVLAALAVGRPSDRVN